MDEQFGPPNTDGAGALRGQSNEIPLIPRRYQSITQSPPAPSAFLYPGLASEDLGRLAEFHSLFSEFGDVLQAADAIISPVLSVKLSDLVTYGACDGKKKDWKQRLRRAQRNDQAPLPTVVAHSLLFAIEFALTECWKTWGIRPDFVCGYSLGEYSAACAAGVFDFPSGLRLVQTRAQLLDALPRGSMIAVSTEAHTIRRYLAHETFVVAENAPNQTIIGGSVSAVAHLESELHGAGIVSQRLAVEFPFHTPLLAKAQAALADAFSRIETRPPNLAVVSTLTGDLANESQLRSPDYWAAHLCEPIRFREAIKTLIARGATVFLEIGPAQTLAPVAAEIAAPDITVLSTMPSVFDARPLAQHLLTSAGRLSTHGHPVTLSAIISNIQCETHDEPMPETVDLTDRICAIWAKALRRPYVARHDNLFDIGGTSLVTARIILEMRRALGVDVTARDIYSAATPSRLATTIQTGVHLQNRTATLLTLPNGLRIRYQSQAEATYFYKTIFEDRCYLRHGIYLPANATVFDVGANIGMFALFVTLSEPTARLICIEPAPPLIKIAQFNLFDISNTVRFINAGASDISGRALLTFYPENSGMSSFAANLDEEENVLSTLLRNQRDSGQEAAAEILADPENLNAFLTARLRSTSFTVPLLTISQIMANHEIDTVDLLKIDVQKFERQVLEGVRAADWPKIRQVVVEVHNQDGALDAICDLLAKQGLQTIAEQDPLYRGTNIFTVFASRKLGR